MAETKYNAPAITPPTDDLVDVATDPTYSSGPFPGSANKVAPATAVQTEGFVPGQEPPAESFNYIFNNHQQYMAFNGENQVQIYEYFQAGTYELVVPENVGMIKIIAVGGGGGGGGGGGRTSQTGDPSYLSTWGGGGGGGSGLIIEQELPFYPFDSSGSTENTTLSITVGDGGAGGAASEDTIGSRAGRGDSSTVSYKTISPSFPAFGPGGGEKLIISAPGGQGGVNKYIGVGGTEGVKGVDGGSGYNGGGGGGGGSSNDITAEDGGAGGKGGNLTINGSSGSDSSSSTPEDGGTGGLGLANQMNYNTTAGLPILNSRYGIPFRFAMPTPDLSAGGQGGGGATGHLTYTTYATAGPANTYGAPGVGVGGGGAGAGGVFNGTFFEPGTGTKGAPGGVLILVYPTVYTRVTP